MNQEAIRNKETRFMAILDDNRRLIYKVCYMYADDSEHFNDLYQEVLANIWQGLDSFRGDSRQSTWIYRVAINTCVTYYRRNSPHTSGRIPIENVTEIEAPDNSRGDQLREMYRLIGGLPKMDKALILLWLNEKSYDEIAEIAGLPRNTVATRLRRIKQKLVEQNNK
ncbi:MAG: sigma-70 family RNA polymerase sigma factor [Duncaniella sp.]|nr:sigma-70 family RNA polymerase sigma factor [Duncaniella sp.]